MKTKITILFIFLLTVTFSYGQKKKSSTANKNWGVGVKLGDPLGLSLKKYMGNNKALELIVGRSYYWGGYDYDYYYRHDDRFKNNNNYRFRNAYNYSTPIAIQLRYLIHNDIGGVEGLQWYVGAGVQFRYQSFHYYYDYYDQFGDYVTRSERAVDYGIGLDFIGGLEYTFENVPISIAVDANLYLEIIDRPFLPLLQGGVTGRYNF